MEKDHISIKTLIASICVISAILIIYNLFSSPSYTISHTALDSTGSAVSSTPILQTSSKNSSQDVSEIHDASLTEPESQIFAASSANESSGLININTASSEELQKIKYIGPTLAGRIIEYRELNGPFNTLDELLEVNGIGEKKLAIIKEYACV